MADGGPEKQMTVEDWEVSIRLSPSRHKWAINACVRRLVKGRGLSTSMYNMLEAALNTGDL